jgi:hypothetical protein
MLFLRRVLFILFVFLYLTCCPLIILYALGFNLTPGSERNFVRTGLISLSSLPAGATIYLDNLRFPGKTAAVIRHLPPREYSVKLVLENYKTWQKNVPVKAEKASVLENVLLLPKIWKPQPLALFPSETIIPLDHNSIFLVKEGPLVENLLLYRIADSAAAQLRLDRENIDRKSPLTPLFPTDTIYNQARVMSWFTAPESPLMLLHLNLKGGDKFLWIDLRQKPPLIDDITDLFPQKPRKVFWDRQEHKNIFSYEDHALARLATASKAIYPNIAQNIRGWGVANQKIYILSQDHVLKRMSFDGKDEEFILPDRSFVLSNFGKDKEYQIFVLAEDLLLFLSQEGELLTNRFPFKLVEGRVKNFVFDEESERLLVWTEHDLGIIDFSLPNQDHLFGPGPLVTWLTKTAENIEQAFWVNRGTYVLYRDQSKVVLMETEKFNKPAGYEIMQVKRNSAVVYSDATGTLYYLDGHTQQLSALTVVPEQDFFAFQNRRKKDQEP